MRRKPDWLATLHRTRDWRGLADWLCSRGEYLLDNMQAFASDMLRNGLAPTQRQAALLIKLRADIEASP